MSLPTANIPKAVLYYNQKSVWSSSALLALEEKGYDEDEVELRVVDLGKAENLSMSFLRINPKGTVPTLVVPLAKTLAPDDDHRFKAVTDTKSILEFLDKSRSAISRTHTISSAPAPALAPATIVLSLAASQLIDILHTDDVNPNQLKYYNYTSQAAFARTAETLLPFFRGRQEALSSYITSSQNAQIQASEKTRKLWESKKADADAFVAVYAAADKDDSTLSPAEKAARDQFRSIAHDLWNVKLRKAITVLNKEMMGPFALGDQISIVDLHLGPWLARIAALCGGLATDNGDVIISKIESRIGDRFALPKDFQQIVAPELGADPFLQITPGAKRVKLAVFWDEMKGRASWMKVYRDGLH
ncbi:hypothetical protein ACEPAF_3471 [Sanghuangporus sanghuang]